MRKSIKICCYCEIENAFARIFKIQYIVFGRNWIYAAWIGYNTVLADPLKMASIDELYSASKTLHISLRMYVCGCV